MLTTLTVAVVLPLKPSNLKKQRNEESLDAAELKTTPEKAVPNSEKYVCCVCNVGDTLAYVYSQKYGIRELTKGSHDVYCNRDMRDALGALGPVDGNFFNVSIRGSANAKDITLLRVDLNGSKWGRNSIKIEILLKKIKMHSLAKLLGCRNSKF